MTRKWGSLLLLMLLLPSLALAQATGKLAGKITDRSTGDVLPGATVVIEGTTLGTASDANGDYVIIGVPVGNYDVRVSFVGFTSETRTAVEINAGYTRQLDFQLMPGIELDEVVVTYVRPAIQKDAVGVPKIITSEELEALPVRGAADAVKIQAGVVAFEGSDALYIRGGRNTEVTYYIDGVKVTGTTNLPQAAIAQAEVQIGNINARYGDVMSGVINVTTKSGGNQFLGSFEGITSQQLDPYGYNLLSGMLSGPIIKDKLSFFVAGEYTDQKDSDPRATTELYVSDDILDGLRSAPQGFLAKDANGNSVNLSIPRSIGDGAKLLVDDDGVPVVNNGQLSFSDGTTVAVPSGVNPGDISLASLIQRAEYLSDDDFEWRKDKRGRGYQDLSMTGNLNWNVFGNARLRLGGRLNMGDWDSGYSNRRVIFAPEMQTKTNRDEYQVFGTWTQNLSNTTFFQLQADWTDRKTEVYDPRFGTTYADFLEYGNIDNSVFATLAGYRDLTLVNETRVDDHGTPDDPSDDTEFIVKVPTLSQRYSDGSGPSTSDEVIATLAQAPGGRFNGYQKSHDNQIRFSGMAATQIGLHQIEFGGEYEKRTNRLWSINAATLSRYVADGDPEQIAPDDPTLNPEGYSSFDAIPAFVLDDIVTNNYGYDLRGKNEINEEDFAAFLNQDITKPEVSYNLKPYEPIYYGGYIQDKIEFDDLILNLGVRVDVFDNNIRVLKDRFSRRPVCRVANLGSSVNGVDCGVAPSTGIPENVGEDWAVFYSGDDVLGYRNLNGNFYDVGGQETTADVSLLGQVRSTSGQITTDMFEDYKPQVTFMPRIGVSFPITDQALFFASYGVTSQRPSSRTFATLNALQGSGGINNTNLRPERTTKYELGFRQRLGELSTMTISGFFHQIENLIQQREIRGATPSTYISYENVDFGTVKGAEFDFELRRINGVAARYNYTLSFADGTGSFDATTGTIVWVSETPPNFISPLDFDQRHKMNLTVDYRLEKGEGPTILGTKLLENFNVSVLTTLGSGFPYTPIVEPFNLAGAARPEQPKGGINSARMPWNSRVDLRVDRDFYLSGQTRLSAFLWVQNVFDGRNVNNVWEYTGLPDDDGFLGLAAGARFLADKPPVAETLYHHRNAISTWVGIPRTTRLGLKLEF